MRSAVLYLLGMLLVAGSANADDLGSAYRGLTIAKVRIEQDVEIAVPAYPGEVFRGRVSYIGDVVNEETRTITVRAEVGNDDFRLRPGMFADVDIVLNGGEQALVVPLDAILEEGSQKIVFVEQSDGFARREVETGVADGGYQQILKGLEAGEKVVGYPFEGYWQDLGRHEDYEQAVDEFEQMRPQILGSQILGDTSI